MNFQDRYSNHLKDNWGKYLGAAGATGMAGLGIYASQQPEIADNIAHFGKNIKNILGSDLSLDQKLATGGLSGRSSWDMYQRGLSPYNNEHTVETQINLPSDDDQSRSINLRNMFMSTGEDKQGIPNIYFNEKNIPNSGDSFKQRLLAN